MTRTFALGVELHVIRLGERRVDAEHLRGLLVHGDDVGLFHVVAVEVVQAVLLEDAARGLFVLAVPDQRDIPEDAGALFLGDLVRVELVVLRDPRRPLQRLGVHRHGQVQRVHEVGADPALGSVVVDLAEGAARDRDLVEQGVGVALPIVHAVEDQVVQIRLHPAGAGLLGLPRRGGLLVLLAHGLGLSHHLGRELVPAGLAGPAAGEPSRSP
jgi:hypothetical protein